MSDQIIHLFDNFALDQGRGFLVRGDELVHLRPQTYEVLRYLVEHRGQLVTKDKVIEDVWRGRAVTDGSLGKCIEELREALGDTSMSRVRTVRGRGYFFDLDAPERTIKSTSEQIDVLRVVVVDEEDGGRALARSEKRRSAGDYLLSAIKQHRLAFIAAAIALATVAIVLVVYFRGHKTDAAIQSIAVLPFVNASGNGDVEYLSDGMTDVLITSLSQLPQLSVKARSSVFRYKGRDASPQQVGRELNVQAILSGRLVQRGDEVILHIELVDVQKETVLWSADYNRSMTNLASLQSEIARDVAQKLRMRLPPLAEQKLAKHYTDNTEAYRLYLKGNYEWNKHTHEDLQQAVKYYNEALEKDPNYALAYSGLSASYGVLGNNYLAPSEAFPKAKAYAARAIEVDETLAEGHSAMGAVRLFYDWNWVEAEREIKRALALNPNYEHAHDLYSAYLQVMGRSSEAQAETKLAQELDPLSLMFSTNLGIDFYYGRQYDQAIAQLEQTINLDRRYNLAYLWLGQAYVQKRMYAEAIATFQKGLSQGERHPKLLALLGHTYALSGERDKAKNVLGELSERSKQSYISPYLFAVVYVGLGDQNQAFAWLEKAFQDRSFLLIWLKVEPLFDSLRGDPRYADLLRRIGLAVS